jgi:outer membrane protein
MFHRCPAVYAGRVFRHTFVLVFATAAGWAEIHSLTLRQAVEIALKENADLVLSRLDEQKAQDSVRIARDPFVPKLYAGSGLAKVWGYPSSIEGAAPSIIQTRTDMSLFNRPKSYELARVRENARGANITTQSKSDEIAYQTASLFLDAQQIARNLQSLKLETESQERVSEAVKLRVDEGRELPIENKRLAADLARARQRYEAAVDDVDYVQASLAVVLGYPAGDRVQPVDDDRQPPEVPASEQAAREQALQNNKELRRLESQLQAKGLEVREYQSTRLPVIDLVAQYALFAKSNYQAFFTNVQRNNAELGVSITIPLLTGSAAKGLASQAQLDVLQLRTQMNQARNRIELDTQKSYQDLQKSEAAQNVARLDLDYAREQVSLLLAQLAEGRATQQQLDDSRLNEQEKWIVFYAAQHGVEKARLALLRQTGTLLAVLR